MLAVVDNQTRQQPENWLGTEKAKAKQRRSFTMCELESVMYEKE